jgi:hypothetical protein
MSAVAKPLKKAVKGIGKVVEKVGKAVKKVAEVIVETAKYVAENPEILVIAIAAPQLLPYVGVPAVAVQPVTAALISASQGGDLEDIGKAALGTYIGQPVGQYVGAKTATAIGASNTAQNALASAVGGAAGGAAGAVVTGADVGESALMSAAGSAGASLAGAGATSLGAEEGSRAAKYSANLGEALGRTAAGGDLTSELIGSAFDTLRSEGDIAVTQLRQPTIKNATAYFPPISPEMAALTGSTIDGSPVGDVNLISGLPNAPKMFSEGDMVVPTNARTSSPYTVRNEQGEVFQARDLTYQDGTVQRIIFDPNTQQYQQQVLQQPSIRTGESALPGIEVSGGQGGILANPDPNIRTGQRATDTAKTAREILDRRAAERERGTAGAATAPSGIERQPSGPITGGRDAGGMGEGEMVGTDRPAEEMTGSELLGDAIAGGERGEDVGGGGRGGRGGGGGGEGLSEAPLDLEAMTDEELLALLEDSMDFDAEDTPLIPPDDTGVTGGLDVRTTLVGKPKAYQSSISPRVVGSSPTAAIVGEKEPIFGGEENAQSDLWNTRSLRLRKALGL